MSTKGFEVVEHTADWSLRVTGRDLPELFANAATGMAHLLVSEPHKLPEDEVRNVSLEAYDTESLLVDWLGELAYFAEVEQLIFHSFERVTVSATALEATIRGAEAAEIDKHIKAVTYHDLEIRETADGLEATIVFDV